MQGCRTDKVQYKTAGDARAAIRAIKAKGKCPALRVYTCGDHHHLTKQSDPSGKWTPPSAKSPKPYVPSAKTIRGRIENYSREIAACQRRVRKADELLARATAKAENERKKAEQAHAEELRYIEREINRLHRI